MDYEAQQRLLGDINQELLKRLRSRESLTGNHASHQLPSIVKRQLGRRGL